MREDIQTYQRTDRYIYIREKTYKYHRTDRYTYIYIYVNI